MVATLALSLHAVTVSWSNSGKNISGGLVTDFSFSVADVARVIAGGSSSNVTVNDQIFTRTSGATSYTDKRITVDPGTMPGGSTWTFASSDTSVATVDAYGFVKQQTNGVATISMTSGRSTKGQQFTFTTTGGATVQTFSSFVTGSLAKHIADTIDGALAGKSANTGTYNLYSTANDSTTNYVRNSSLWLGTNFDLSAVSVYNSAGSGFQMTAITPWTLLGAKHVGSYNGTNTVFRFLGTDGQVVSRTLAASADVGSTDIRLWKLSASLPSTVVPAKLLPSNWNSYIKLNNGGYALPVVTISQYRKMTVNDVFSAGTNTTDNVSVGTTSTSQRTAFYSQPQVGDSGMPSFVPVNGTLALLFDWHYYYSGPVLPNNISAINTALSGLGDTNTVQTVSLSGFNTY